MKFIGISKELSLENEEQYNTIGTFWDEMALLYGLDDLQGLGYKWENKKIFYAIGLKCGVITNANYQLELPNYRWNIVEDQTNNLKNIYDEIYIKGPLKYEI